MMAPMPRKEEVEEARRGAALAEVSAELADPKNRERARVGGWLGWSVCWLIARLVGWSGGWVVAACVGSTCWMVC